MRKPYNGDYKITSHHLEPYGNFPGVPPELVGKPHKGYDYATPIGTPVYAPESGIINFAGYDRGLGIVIQGMALHKLWHLSKAIVSKGQSVSEGQLIGYSGNSGGVAAHLHWETWVNGELVDPHSLLFKSWYDFIQDDYKRGYDSEHGQPLSNVDVLSVLVSELHHGQLNEYDKQRVIKDGYSLSDTVREMIHNEKFTTWFMKDVRDEKIKLIQENDQLISQNKLCEATRSVLSSQLKEHDTRYKELKKQSDEMALKVTEAQQQVQSYERTVKSLQERLEALKQESVENLTIPELISLTLQKVLAIYKGGGTHA